MDERVAWLAQAEILKEVTERLGIPDETIYRHAHQLAGDEGDSDVAGASENGLSLRVYQCKPLRLFCMLHRNGGGKRPCLLAEEIRFTLQNMHVWCHPDDENIGIEGDVARLSLAPGESTFLIVRPKSLGKYCVNFSREVHMEQTGL